ncbi:hypothetical protein AN478_11280 [Thiohalorhabdus denitrificans]|uniref:Ion channel n=1 Tax=Thiohalorhabdus denitrificans TaxID=381306 RepID=A0A0P9C3X6_9GAMM|nr:potassium channel family protein [Thiohalorhabdus denitrificans]KPV39687.1 hypothetical protein AN478_11280 [Thiohalorhabdus denitrificans]SCX93926.1 Ion channel [Thiohalorhabdus denitrificans]
MIQGLVADAFPWGVVAGLTALVPGLCVLLHYEGLRALSNGLDRLPGRPRPRIVVLVLSLLLLHTVEVGLFGTAFFLVPDDAGLGTIVARSPEVGIATLMDHLYFSATVYTTVGFGDMVPQGPVRLLVGLEAITGLVLITWSASFTYLVMQRYWNGS